MGGSFAGCWVSREAAKPRSREVAGRGAVAGVFFEPQRSQRSQRLCGLVVLVAEWFAEGEGSCGRELCGLLGLTRSREVAGRGAVAWVFFEPQRAQRSQSLCGLVVVPEWFEEGAGRGEACGG